HVSTSVGLYTLHPFSLLPPTPFHLHTLSLHDALPILPPENSIDFYLALRKAKVPAELHIYERGPHGVGLGNDKYPELKSWILVVDRKSTRLNSSHVSISYAVFCLKKKTNTILAHSAAD